jgi:DNA-binding beta-propeller fold protein YncE
MKTANLVKLLGFFLLCGAAQCATPPRQAAQPVRELLWPQPPDEPRIRFVQVVSAPTDLGINGSFWERTLSLVAGKKQINLRMPQQICIGPSGRLYVTDQSDKSLHVFDLKKKHYFKISKYRNEPISSPGGIAEGEDGTIYFSDTLSRKIFVFDSRGKPVRVLGGPEIFGRPTGMVYLPDNKCLYVLDTLNHQVKVLDETGKVQFQFGSRGEENGEFNYPTYIGSDNKDHLYVTDTLNHRIEVFDKSGKFISAFGKAGDAFGSFSIPKGVAVDSHGHIYVVDSIHDAIQIFDATGQLLLSFCSPGNDEGELWLPGGIAINPENLIYVADTFNGRIQVFQLLFQDEA